MEKKRSVGITLISLTQLLLGLIGGSLMPCLANFLLLPFIIISIYTFRLKNFAWKLNLIGNPLLIFLSYYWLRGAQCRSRTDQLFNDFMGLNVKYGHLVVIAVLILNTLYFTRTKVKRQFTE